MSTAFAVFGEREHRRRLARARRALESMDCGVCVAVAPETHYYLAGYDAWVGVNSPQALVFGADDDDAPTLLVRDVDAPLARETSWLEDLRIYRLFKDDFAERVAAIVRGKGCAGRRIAMEKQSYALPAALHEQLADTLTGEIVDATRTLGDLRHIKSAAELVHVREAARYANLGLAAARDHLRPGVSEIELAAEIESAMRRGGSDYWSIPTELSSGPRTAGGHATPRQRLIERGDLVHMEFAGVAQRYHATAVHTMACGEPGRRAREVYCVARASLAAGIAACRPGVRADAVEEASLAPVRAAGMEANAIMRFGYGLGIAYPPVWLETLQISRGFANPLTAGMTFVLHACLQLDGESLGVIQGGTWVMHAEGPEQLVGGGDVPLELVA